MDLFITAEALRDCFDEVTVFDLRFRLEDLSYHRVVYEEGHIPGAFYLDFEEDLSDPKGDFGGDHPFLLPEDFAQLLEGFGLKDDSTVVLYDEASLMSAARFIYQSRFSGLSIKIHILKGGYGAWLAAGGAEETAIPQAPGGGNLSTQPRPDLICKQDTVKEKMDDPTSLLIDSRAPQRYLGQVEPRYRIAGHIPGALNYFFKDVIAEDGGLKDRAYLEDHFAGLDKYNDIILSCGSGGSACVNSLALQALGIPHRLYNGSYSDWVANLDNPVNTGDEGK